MEKSTLTSLRNAFSKKSMSVIFVSTFIIVGFCTYAQNFRKEPYLLYPDSNTEMYVIWQLDASASCSTEWNTIKNAADIYIQDGVFTTFRGFEWSHNTHGHVTILNTDDYCTRTSIPTFTQHMPWINAHDCAAFLNHTGLQNVTGEEFGHFTDTPSDKVVGMELWNKTDNFPMYYYADGYCSGDGNLSWIDEGNTRGWKIDAGDSEDNHNGTFGIWTNSRMKILSNSLTRTDIYEKITQTLERFFTHSNFID